MKFLYFWIVMMVSFQTFSQRVNEKSNQSSQLTQINQIKIAKLTSDMKLSKTQAEKFWPVFNSFDKQRKELRREIRQLSQSFSEDDDAYKRQDRILYLKQQELDLTKKFKPEFLKIISEQQYGIMLVSEERFNQVLIEKLRERSHD